MCSIGIRTIRFRISPQQETKPMRTIAISRLTGTEAGAIAQRLVETLGYDLVDRGVLDGTFRQYGLTKFGELYTSPPNIWDLVNSKNLQIVSMLNEIMEALAHRGRTLILVRGGYASLSKYPDVLNVRLQAPFPIRVGTGNGPGRSDQPATHRTTGQSRR